MLDANKVEDIREISKYGKAKGVLIAKRYGLPTFSNFFVIETEEDAQLLLDRFKNQNDFCMRSDSKEGNIPVGVAGKNGNRETILEYIKEINQKASTLGTNGVALIYWNDKFCPTYEIEGSFYLDFIPKQALRIDYIGKGWDGSYLSHGTACHESYYVPWNEILFLKDKNRGKYREKVVNEQEYRELREIRIRELSEKYRLSKEKAEEVVPCKYKGIKNEYFRQVIDQIMLPMYDSPELQRIYREYIPIVQIENGKVICPEIILPTRLKNIQRGKDIDER